MKQPLSPKLAIRAADHRFYTGMAVLGIVVVILGFWPTYFEPLLQSTYSGGSVVKVHALAFLAWMGVFLTQCLLVKTRRSKVHRRVGTYGVLLGAVMVVLGVAVSILLVRRLLAEGAVDSVGAGIWAASEPFLDITQFAVLLAWAYASRRDPDRHKRLMLLATVSILPAATARMYYLIGPWSMELMFGAMAGMIVFHDWKTQGRVSRTNVIGLLILLPRALLAASLKM